MNTNGLAKNYDRLTPAERFKLIIAAGARGDDAERDRLAHAAGKITYSVADHAPHANALQDLASYVYLELLEEAARYRDAALRVAALDDEPRDDESRAVSQRLVDLAMVAGCMLNTKAGGWRLFCERLQSPPFILWESLPGFKRLQHALDGAEQLGFTPAAMLKWINDVRPAGEPERKELRLTAESIAEETMAAYRELVKHHGGEDAGETP